MSDFLNPAKDNGCILCYSGSKHRYSDEIKAVLPKENKFRVCDIFAGGGSVTTALPESWHVVGNDKESRIIDIHNSFQDMLVDHTVEDVHKTIVGYCHSKVSSRTDELGFEQLKKDYNIGRSPSDLYALATSSNSNYIRFNNSGEFNIKFGKRWLNPSLQKKLYNYLYRTNKRSIDWISEDFRDIDFNSFDLLIVDPPYAFNGKSKATYNEKGGWQLQDLVALFTKLDKAHEQGVRWVFFNEVLTKGQDNPIIVDWVNKYNVKILKDTLSGCSYQRTDKRSVEVMVTNY